MESKVILCPKCRFPNAPGASNCKGCGIRLCCQCNSVMPVQLGVCPQCGWWDPNWKSPLRDTNKDATDRGKSGKVYTKKLEFKCAQCGANVAHDAEKCNVCGYVGHMQLRDKQNKSSSVNNTHSNGSVHNHSINTKYNELIRSKPRSGVISSKSKVHTFLREKNNTNTSKKSFDNTNGKVIDKAEFWGYETKEKKFPLWLLLAIVFSVIILAALVFLMLLVFQSGN